MLAEAQGASSIHLYVDSLGNRLQSPTSINATLLLGLVSVSFFIRSFCINYYSCLLTIVCKVPKVQEYHQKQFDLGELRVGRFETIDFWSQEQGLSFAESVPRFSITILDSPGAAQR